MEKEQMSRDEYKFYRQYVSVPGQHAIVVGPTGVGKTNLLLWMLQAQLLHRTKIPMKQWETIVWFDIGKSSEILNICCSLQAPCRLIIPEMMDVHVELFDPDNTYCEIEKVWITDETEIWQNLSRDRVNIICFEGFIREIDRMVPFIKRTFNSLINQALDYKLRHITPMSIYYDEFHNICPSKGNAASQDIFKHGGDIQLNIEKLRSQGVRFNASCHKWSELRSGVRNAFMFILCMRGANFPGSEQPKLFRFNRKFEKLQTGHVMIAFPGKILSDDITLPFYARGHDFGYVYYRGKLSAPEKAKKTRQRSVPPISDPVDIQTKDLAEISAGMAGYT